jgi:hypothetical protein
MTLLKYFLLVDDLDDSGQSTVCSSMAYMRVNVFPSCEPFLLWPDPARRRIAIEAISSLGHEGLVEFWPPLPYYPDKRVWTSYEVRDWIRTHRLDMSDVDGTLERLTPIWWTGERPEDVDWGRTSAGESMYKQWIKNPPAEAH